MTIPVENYGLHKTPEGVYYLHQGRTNAGNMIGLKAPSPFEIVGRRRACPHMINTSTPVPDRNHWKWFMRLFNDPLTQALLPIPKDRTQPVPYLVDPNGELGLHLVALSRLSSPVFQLIRPINKLTPKQILDDLTLTNVAPLILTNVQPSDQALMYEIATQSRLLPRKVLFCGDASLVIHTPMVRLQTNMWEIETALISSLPMESLGAFILRRFARNEPLDADFIRKDDD